VSRVAVAVAVAEVGVAHAELDRARGLLPGKENSNIRSGGPVFLRKFRNTTGIPCNSFSKIKPGKSTIHSEK
jgi:hypothetical protein